MILPARRALARLPVRQNREIDLFARFSGLLSVGARQFRERGSGWRRC
jgi:hypothetical protein